jgi:replication factor C small subunit
LTPNAQAALRNLMETFSKTTRFILTCNYVEKIIDPIQSRCQTFGITPPSKADVAKRTAKILTDEGVEFDMKDLASIVNSNYPDIRRILNTCQRQVIDGKLRLDKESLMQANYMIKVLEILKSNDSKKDSFTAIRQLLADSKVKDFTALYTYLYDNLDTYATGHLASVILVLAESQSTDSFAVDKELHTMAMFIKILEEIR